MCHAPYAGQRRCYSRSDALLRRGISESCADMWPDRRLIELFKIGDVVEETKPEVVSFHFGLPEPGLLQRLKGAGFLVMGSATTAAEAQWLEARGIDAVIAQ